jgi:hypothetical protein
MDRVWVGLIVFNGIARNGCTGNACCGQLIGSLTSQLAVSVGWLETGRSRRVYWRPPITGGPGGMSRALGWYSGWRVRAMMWRRAAGLVSGSLG